MVAIKGIEKFAPKDFPGFITSTIFLGGCNFRCPFCHNSDLVLRPETLPSFPLEWFISYLDSRDGWLEAVCVSGGEPLLDVDLDVLLRVIKDRNLLVKVDTNGSIPVKLKELVSSELVDYIAMDIKAPLEKYGEATDSDVCPEEITESIEIVRGSGRPYMFRTTLVPGLIEAEDIVKIARMLEGSSLYQLQQFSPANTINKDFLMVKPYPKEEILCLADLARPYFSEVRIEGV